MPLCVLRDLCDLLFESSLLIFEIKKAAVPADARGQSQIARN